MLLPYRLYPNTAATPQKSTKTGSNQEAKNDISRQRTAMETSMESTLSSIRIAEYVLMTLWVSLYIGVKPSLNSSLNLVMNRSTPAQQAPNHASLLFFSYSFSSRSCFIVAFRALFLRNRVVVALGNRRRPLRKNDSFSKEGVTSPSERAINLIGWSKRSLTVPLLALTVRELPTGGWSSRASIASVM